MKTPTSVINLDEMREISLSWEAAGEKISFVPTMGALHEGHISLIKKAKECASKLVVSIFVNPAQFGPGEDFSKYPRDLESDLQLLAPHDIDVVFLPNAADIFPEDFQTYIYNGKVAMMLCGATRKGHFQGVCTVVQKLFNIIRPHKAFFGKKDYQQWKIIDQMVKDLFLNIEIEAVETEREENGLALSSRNRYLDDHHRQLAGMIPISLNAAFDSWEQGVRSRNRLEAIFMDKLSEYQEFSLDYVKVCNQSDLGSDSDEILEPAVMLVAVMLQGVRLIDNIEFDWNGR